jgi:hypothetical protein
VLQAQARPELLPALLEGMRARARLVHIWEFKGLALVVAVREVLDKDGRCSPWKI